MRQLSAEVHNRPPGTRQRFGDIPTLKLRLNEGGYMGLVGLLSKEHFEFGYAFPLASGKILPGRPGGHVLW